MDAEARLAVLLQLEEDEEEEMEEEELLLLHSEKDRRCTSDMFNMRESEGVFKILVNNHLIDDEIRFKQYFRFTKDEFYGLYKDIQDVEELKSQVYNRNASPIPVEMKLALTLRFLATRESFRSLAFSYRISPSEITQIVPKVLKVLEEKLMPKYLPSPSEIDWKEKSDEFWKRWDFPNLVGALDGKHVRIVAPNNTGSLYFNYKKYFSVVLFALVDANCKFLIVDVGSYGKEGDSGIFQKSHLGKMIDDGKVIFPPPEYLPNSNILLPHVVLGDEAFKLDKHMMKCYSKRQAVEDPEKRTLNYHFCKVRRVSENAFGIMCSIFRIFFTPINVKPETVDKIIVVCCCLHNLIRNRFLRENPNHGLIDETVHEFPVENMIPLAGTGGYARTEGFKVRERFAEYFNGKSAKRK